MPLDGVSWSGQHDDCSEVRTMGQQPDHLLSLCQRHCWRQSPTVSIPLLCPQWPRRGWHLPPWLLLLQGSLYCGCDMQDAPAARLPCHFVQGHCRSAAKVRQRCCGCSTCQPAPHQHSWDIHDEQTTGKQQHKSAAIETPWVAQHHTGCPGPGRYGDMVPSQAVRAASSGLLEWAVTLL